MVCDHVSCALRGYGPDFRKSGPFASLRSVQGAAPLAPLCGYPCALAGKVHPLCVCTFPARLKPNTVTLDRLPDTAGRRSFVLPRRRSNTMDKSREELSVTIPVLKLRTMLASLEVSSAMDARFMLFNMATLALS